MEDALTEYIGALVQQYKGKISKAEFQDFLLLSITPLIFGIEDKMLDFLRSNPDAAWRETEAHMRAILDELNKCEDIKD